MAKKLLINIEVDAKFGELNQLEKRLDNLKNSRKALLAIQKKNGSLDKGDRARLTALTQEISIQTKERSKLTRAVQQENKERRGLVTQYEKESAKLNTLRKQLKNLILTEKGGSKATEKLAREVHVLDKRLKGVDARAGQFQRSVGIRINSRIKCSSFIYW